MAQVHPRRDDAGRQVIVRQPTLASVPTTWTDPDAVAVFVPGGAVPAVLGEVPLRTARLPAGPPALARLCGPDAADPPLPPLPPGKAWSAGAAILEADGRVWVMEPTNHFAGVRLTLPKGRVEAGRTLRRTAVQEAFEETGLVIALGAYLLDLERSVTMVRYFVAHRVGGTPAEMGWEAQSAQLATPSRLRTLIRSPAEQGWLEKLPG